MKNVIPFNKEIQFDNNIYEISSISLEHDEKVSESVVGTLTISGEYRTHELSVNKENFKYDLPFNIELDDNIIRDSVVIDIDDFTYEIKNNSLDVSIMLSIYGDKVEDNEEDNEEVNELIEEIEKRNVEEDEEDNIETEEIEEERINECEPEDEEERDVVDEEKVNDEMVLNNVSETNEYITYKVHIVTESETIESICALYKVSSSLISDYNDISTFGVGDKLIIPIETNE